MRRSIGLSDFVVLYAIHCGAQRKDLADVTNLSMAVVDRSIKYLLSKGIIYLNEKGCIQISKSQLDLISNKAKYDGENPVKPKSNHTNNSIPVSPEHAKILDAKSVKVYEDTEEVLAFFRKSLLATGKVKHSFFSGRWNFGNRKAIESALKKDWTKEELKSIIEWGLKHKWIKTTKICTSVKSLLRWQKSWREETGKVEQEEFAIMDHNGKIHTEFWGTYKKDKNGNMRYVPPPPSVNSMFYKLSEELNARASGKRGNPMYDQYFDETGRVLKREYFYMIGCPQPENIVKLKNV